MSFPSLTANGQTFLPTAPTEYHKTGSTFADPSDYVRLRAGAVRKDKALSAGLTRIREKDVTLGSDVTRKGATASLNLVLPRDGSFTAADLSGMVSDLAALATETLLEQMMQGRY